MKLLCWNVNGLQAVMGKGFVDFVHEEKPDVLCLQEIKGQRDVEEHFPNYEFHWNPAEKKGYSGTLIMIKKGVAVVGVHNHIDVQEHDTEGRVITAEFDDFYLVNVYVPNSGRGLVRLDYRGTWDEAFRNYLEKLQEKKDVLVCGDLNVAHTAIDLKNDKSNYNKTAGYTQQEIDGFDALLKTGFIDTFRKRHEGEEGHYTYWSYMFNARAKNVGWRIDYFLATPALNKKVKKSYILPEVMGSDHCPIGVELQ